MGAPSISISFIEKGITAITRGERGIVGLVVTDTAKVDPKTLLTVKDIPSTLTDANKTYCEMALKGYQTTPKKVLLYVMSGADDYDAMQTYFESTKFNYLVVTTAETDGKADTLATWIKGLNDNAHKQCFAVLPNVTADSENIINVTSGYSVGETTYTAEQACARIAGIIAGTPMSISCTYAPITEATDCDRLSQEELDTKVDNGELCLVWDGTKVKVCRGVTSFKTTTDTKGDSFKKIKLVDTMHMIYDDIKVTAEDNYIGKYANTYDNKCLLLTAVNAYFNELVRGGVLQSGDCSIDIDAVKTYLEGKGEDVSDYTDDDFKKANTDSHVFLKASISVLDAIEDIDLIIYL